MKTSVDIPENELAEAMKLTGAKTKREAVVIAISEFNRKKRLEKLVPKLGTFDGFQTLKQLQVLRRHRKWK